MSEIYVTRHVAVTAAGQTTFANNLAGTAESIVCPTAHLAKIGVSISKSITDVAGAGATFGLRLVGPLLGGGQQDMTVGSLTSDTTSTAGAKVQLPFYLDVDISCTAGGTITASVFENGVDPGTAEAEVTLCFN